MALIGIGLVVIAVIAGIIVLAFLPGHPENYKKCQHCGKSVKIETVVCKYCKKDLVDLPFR